MPLPSTSDGKTQHTDDNARGRACYIRQQIYLSIDRDRHIDTVIFSSVNSQPIEQIEHLAIDLRTRSLLL